MDEYVDLNEIIQHEETEEPEEIVLGTVTAVGSNGVQIQADGAEEAGTKDYKVNSMQLFAVGDRVKILKNSGTYLIEYVVGTPMARYPIPAGGSDGQVLTKDGANDYAVKWAAAPHGIPSGGSANQVLTKNSATDYDVTWSNAAHDLPTGGSTGQYLRKKSATNYDVEWATAAHDLPTGGSTGQYLKKKTNTNYDVEWGSAPSTDRLSYSSNYVVFDNSSLHPNSTCSLGSSSYYFNGCYLKGAIRLGNSSYDSTLGFFGKTPVSKQTLYSSSTLANVITALQNYGLC